MKKIIFLDFDGVMDTAYYDHYLNYMGMPTCDEYGAVFDPECVAALRSIIQQTEADCRYVIIDDMDASEFNDEQTPFLLTVNPYNGLNDDAARRAVSIMTRTHYRL